MVRTLWWGLAFAAPLVLIALAVVLSPNTSFPLVQQNLGFLGSYVGGLTWSAKIGNTITLLNSERFIIPAALVLVWLAALSTVKIALARGMIIALGLLAILVGGTGFAHYLLLLFGTLAIAFALPVRGGVEPLRGKRVRTVTPALAGVLAVAGILVGVGAGKLIIASPRVVVNSLSASSVLRESSMTEVCPVGSRVMVWGWAADLYVNYGWRNSVPFLNTLGLMSDPVIRDADAVYVSRAIDTSDCVVVALGPPFFGGGPKATLRDAYPEFSGRLDSQYRVDPGALTCDECTVYVRNRG
jgi:hypothetical protein